MTKKATVSMDPTCIELVRAGVITYRQLNEVHRLVQETGGSFEDVLVSKGYVSKAEIAKRTRPRAPKKKTLRLTYSLDLVKLGLLTFKQLNECHREARSSKGQKTVVDVMVEKGYVTDTQLATIPTPAERQKHKKFSSSWDLFRSGAVSLKALNDCHKHVKLEAPGKSLKEALVEKGYITKDALAEIERKKAAGELEEKGPVRSPFMEKYAKELAEIPADLAEKLRREHLESEGISPEADEAEAKLKEGDLEAAVQAAKTFLGTSPEDDEASSAKTFMDFGGGDEKPAPQAKKSPAQKPETKQPQTKQPETRKPETKKAPKPPAGEQTVVGPREDDADVEFRAARTMLGGDESADEPEDESDDVEMRSAKTMIGADDSDESDGDEDVEMRSAKTMLGADESDESDDVEMRSAKTMLGADESDESDGDEDVEMRSAKTMLGADDEPEADGEFRAAQTFIGDEPSDEKKDPQFRAARTFVDMAEETGAKDADADTAEMRGARTFMDMGSEGEAATATGSSEAAAHTFMDVGEESKVLDRKPGPQAPEAGNAGSTFMDMDLESGNRGGGMFGDGTSSGIAGPGVMMERDAGKSGFQSENTQTGEGEGATFMDLDGAPGAKTKSSALREAFDRAGKSGASGVKSGTEFDRQTGKSTAGQTSVGGQSSASSTSAGTSSAGASSGGSSTASGSSASGSKGSSTAAGASGSGTRPETSASATEADEGKKKKKKKEDEDAYSHPLVGKVIGNCRIVKKLGEGGMGAVFLAEHTKLKRRSVIKIVPAHLATNKQLIKRFEREAQAAAQVKHPNIVDVYSVGEENGVHYIEMEYVDGSALDGLLKDKKVLEQQECLRIIKDACRGLAEAHKNGVVHRDIKPDNIMFTRKGQVKIADFGLARTSSEDLELTKVGQILGTPAYMSPEQCQGKPTDHRCDIYSLGATFYCMITGKRPFTGASVMEIMQKHIDQEPISPREYNPEISVQVVKIILKMLSKKPEDRFQNSEEVIAAIDQFMKEEGTEHLLEVQALLGAEWKIVKKLGQGGMGAVYSARSQVDKPRLKNGELVAIKVLNREVSKEEVARFEQEAKLALQIDHENIIRVLEYKISDSVNYIVMEFVDGKSVRDIIRDEKKLEPKEAARIVREAGKGLGRAHELGIVHRDIKPDNIMIDNKTRAVKVADFGIAKHQSAQSELTQAGVVVGTPHYMSPEQCGGANRGVAVTTRADIYSLGATLYFMVTGQKPFEGDTQMAIILQHLNVAPKPPAEVDPKIGESFSNVILNMMAKKPEYRYATLELAIKDLDAADKGGRVKKRRKIDVPFEEQGAARRLAFLGVGVFFAVALLVLSITLRSDPKHKARDEMTKLMASAEGEVKSLVDVKKFGEADAAVSRAKDKIRSVDFTADKELYKDFEQGLGNLQGRVETMRSARNKEADAIKKRFVEPWTRAKGEVDADRATPVADHDQFCSLAEHYLGTYGEALAPTFEADEKALGDSNVVKEASDARNAMLAEANRAGRERLEKLKDHVRATLEPKLYYHIAQALVGKLENTFQKIRVPGRKDPLALDVASEMHQVVAGYDETEKSKLSSPDLILFRNACYDAEDLERRMNESAKAQGTMVSYPRVIAAFQDAKKTIDKGNQADQARSMHAKLVRERLSELTKIRDDEAQKRVDGAVAASVDLAQEGELGRPLAAIRTLDDTYSQVKGNYDSVEAAKVYLDKLDDARRSVVKIAAQKWREKRDAVDRLAWKERSFLKAEVALREVMANPESKLELEVGGQSRTIAQLAQDDLDALRPQLQLLKPVSEGGLMLEVKDTGPFLVGSDDPHHRDQGPRHEVTGVKTFFIDKTEVTVQQYLRFLRTDKKTGRSLEDVPTEKIQELCFLCRKHDPADSPFCSPDEPQSATGHMPSLKLFDELPTKPVAFVSYYDALAFARWAGKDVPSESQWEKAACWDPATKSARLYPWGDEFRRTAIVGSGANDVWPDPLPQAGSKEGTPDEGKSPYGVLDMAGSLLEWTKDAYKAYPGSTFVDPDFAASYFVIRGGSFRDFNEAAFRGCFRFRARPFERKPNVGFRCVREEK